MFQVGVKAQCGCWTLEYGEGGGGGGGWMFLKIKTQEARRPFAITQ